MDYNTFLQELRDKRSEYTISQTRLAIKAGISRQYLSRIEAGEAIPNEKMQSRIMFALESLNIDNPLDLMFDYVRIRFPTMDTKHVLEDILRIKMKYMGTEDYAFYGYTQQYVIGDVVLMTSLDEKMGILLELKGRGCRQYESYLTAQQRSWIQFFNEVAMEGGIFKRLDLAINDRYGILDVPKLIKKCQNEECISLFRSFRHYQSGELIRHEEQDKQLMGNTLYLGSLKSDIYFCIYQKDYEQFIKNDIPIEEAENKNRFEIRLKNERAAMAAYDLIEFNSADETVAGIINHYVRFADRDTTKDRSDWKTNADWKWFIDTNGRSLKLTTKPEPYTLDKTLRWISHQVAPSFKMALELDKIGGTNTINNMITNAKLSERHKKIIEQQSTDLSEIIC